MTRNLSWLTAKPIAHRGLHDAARGIIENTASAFEAALAANYPIECDLQITADGEAVVFHDETLDRLCNDTGFVKDRSTRELQATRFKSGDHRIQTLGELLDQIQGRVPLVIELKSHWDGDTALVQRAKTVLTNYQGPFALMSFDPDLVETMRRMLPQAPRGMTADRGDDPYYDALPPPRQLELRFMSYIARTEPDFISFYFRDLPHAPVDKLRAQGIPIISWTIRSAEHAALARRVSDQITFEGFAA